MDEKGLISFWNPAAEKIFGYVAKETIGKNLHLLLAPKRYHQDHLEAFRIFQLTGTGDAIDKTLELEAHHKDGHEIAIELSLSKLQIARSWHTIGIIRDITDRRLAEQALRESEERFRVLHDASFGGILIHDQGIIIDCNHAVSTLTGYSRKELIGMDNLRLVAPSWQDKVRENIQSQYQEAYEIEGIKKDGTIFPVRVIGKAIPFKGKQIRVTEFRDITDWKLAEEERKHLQMQLTQAQKMEAIGTLAGGIAHDFNNVLGAILGYVDLSRAMLPKDSPAIQNLDKAIHGINRATDLVGQILAFSRKKESKKEPLNLCSLIEDSIKLLRPLLPSTITIKKQLQEDAHSLLADATNIHQIIMNLCTNAFHAMEQGGGILTVTLQNLDISPEKSASTPGMTPGPHVCLSVSDTGSGISPEVIAKIFDPYFTTKKVGKGSGMGLSIIHTIVHNYNGTISVDSNPGKGTRFDVILPAIKWNNHILMKEPEEAPGGTEHILLVDDEEQVADMERSILEHLGYTVTVFTDSLKAYSAFQEKPTRYDMVITDQTMPVLTGIDLAQQMLKVRKDIPIVICTGFSSTLSKEKALELGVCGFAMKPLSIIDLARLIRKIFADKTESA